ncbi:MAG: TlpA family protein disulfide reductase [Chitinophagaceae bacterium]|nr:TlpA family protein disulfide reductase [Chitinophagaceae bacterium]
MRHLQIFFTLAVACSNTLAQPAAQSLSGTIQGFPNGQVFILKYNNSHLFAYEVMDSTHTDSMGYFNMVQPVTPGMYRICQGRRGWYSSNPGNTLHLWLGFGEEVSFHTLVNDCTGSARFSKGWYNTWWFDNERVLQPYLQRLSISMQLLDIYPGSANHFCAQIRREYLKAQRECAAAGRRLQKQQPANPLLTCQQRMIVPFTGRQFKKKDRTLFWQQHLLDSVDFSNSPLQASHLLGQKLEQYLGLFGYPYDFISREAMDSGLLAAVRGIIEHAKNGYYTRDNPAVRTASLQFVAAWLYSFCEDKGLHHCLAYTAAQMTEDVFTSTCNVSPGTLQTLQRMQASQRLQPGMPAPEISLNGAAAKSLADIKASKTLVVFWASWCPHCRQELPLLKKLYDSSGHRDWEVLAVSIDTNQQAWTNAGAGGGFGWINYCDLKGWDSGPAKDYGVFATPQFYLLDRQKRIIARPGSVEEVKRMID